MRSPTRYNSPEFPCFCNVGYLTFYSSLLNVTSLFKFLILSCRRTQEVAAAVSDEASSDEEILPAVIVTNGKATNGKAANAKAVDSDEEDDDEDDEVVLSF